MQIKHELSVLTSPLSEEITIDGKDLEKPRVVYCAKCIHPITQVERRIKGTIFHAVHKTSPRECSVCGNAFVACEILVTTLFSEGEFTRFTTFLTAESDVEDFGLEAGMVEKRIWITLSSEDFEKHRNWLADNKTALLNNGKAEILLQMLEDKVITIEEFLANVKPSDEDTLLFFQYVEASLFEQEWVMHIMDKFEEAKQEEDQEYG